MRDYSKKQTSRLFVGNLLDDQWFSQVIELPPLAHKLFYCGSLSNISADIAALFTLAVEEAEEEGQNSTNSNSERIFKWIAIPLLLSESREYLFPSNLTNVDKKDNHHNNSNGKSSSSSSLFSYWTSIPHSYCTIASCIDILPPAFGQLPSTSTSLIPNMGNPSSISSRSRWLLGTTDKRVHLFEYGLLRGSTSILPGSPTHM